MKLCIYINQIIPEIIKNILNFICCQFKCKIFKETKEVLELFNSEEDEILGLTTLLDIHLNILKNSQVLEQMYQKKQVNMSDINMRISQMDSYLEQLEQ